MTETPADYTIRAQRALLRRAARRVILTQLASERSIARWFDVPAARAAELLAELEQNGIVGPADLGTSRSVLHTPDAVQVIDERIPRLPRPTP